ncbi:MAG: lipid-A-disaccharide synthase N-terminal domain-containing protein [Pseudomonadota bacterium]
MEDLIFRLLLVDSWPEVALALFGLCAQAIFMCRFIIQWIASERAGRSYVPVAFWYISICGGLCLATYGVLRQDIVIVLGQTLGLTVYVRNLMLIYRGARARDEEIKQELS